MKTEDFIKKWHFSLNHLNLPTVGIHVGWEKIPTDSKIESLGGNEAWSMLFNCTPPWFKKPKTFRYLMESKDSDYQQILKEESDNGKIGYYRENGLLEPYFCAFSATDRKFILLGDGNHRLFNCIYLQKEERKDFGAEISRTKLDIIYLSNFDEVILPSQIWQSLYV